MLVSNKSFESISDIAPEEIVRPGVIFHEVEQAVIVYCNPELWQMLQEFKQKGLQDLNILQATKMYTQIKKVLKF